MRNIVTSIMLFCFIQVSAQNLCPNNSFEGSSFWVKKPEGEAFVGLFSPNSTTGIELIDVLNSSPNNTDFNNSFSIGIYPVFIYHAHENYYTYFLQGSHTLSSNHSIGMKLSFLPSTSTGHIYNSLYLINKMYNGSLYPELSLFTKQGSAFGIIPNYTYSIPIIGSKMDLCFSSGIGLHLLFNTCIDYSKTNIVFTSFFIGSTLKLKFNRIYFSVSPFEYSLLFSKNNNNGFSCYSNLGIGYNFNFKKQ